MVPSTDGANVLFTKNREAISQATRGKPMDDGTRNFLDAVALFAVFEPMFDTKDYDIRLDSILSALSRDSGLSADRLRSELLHSINRVRPL
jgi:hypothetical protein